MHHAKLFIVAILMAPGALVSQEPPDGATKSDGSIRCTVEEHSGYFCKVHEMSFEAFEVPIAYGFPEGELRTVSNTEYSCRYGLARRASFPNPAPESVSGGCMVMDERTEIRCACATCTELDRRWRDEHGRLHRPWQPPPEGSIFETDLYLRIQELRAFGEEELADCLQKTWDRSFGNR